MRERVAIDDQRVLAPHALERGHQVANAGLLHVGPQGAGARPGPAAYGLGGENPTVTDAQLVLGRLRPGPLAGGVTLDGRLAHQAIETKLAKPLGLSVEDAASGVIRLLEQNLLHAVERLSIERGHNLSRDRQGFVERDRRSPSA